MQRWFIRNSLLLTLLLSPLMATSALAGGEPLPAERVAADKSSLPNPPKVEPQYQLKPFKAYYQAQFDLGINVSGEAIRELQALPNKQWMLTMKASAMIATIEESSRFEILEHQLRSLEYSYQRKVFAKEKQVRQQFDWSNGTVISSIKERSTTLQLEQQTYDKVSYQIQLWQDLKKGLSEMRYTLADGNQIKALEFDRAPEETINTPAGRFETIKVVRDRGEDSTRKTTLWFAKDLEHVIVKLEQIETDGKQYVLLLERLETP